MYKTILSIESSCDETSAAVLQKEGNRITILSNIISSSALLQSKYGGIIPEQAAREQLKAIIPVIKEALNKAMINDKRLTINDIDALAITQGPGLIGSLLVGVETQKVLAEIFNKPLIPVNHLIGHFYANWITTQTNNTKGASKLARAGNLCLSEASLIDEHDNIEHPNPSLPKFPCIGLLVSGGHSDLVLFKDHGQYEYLGGTRDDAAGECFDKSARLLNLPYPGGPQISKLAQDGNPKAYNLPKPMMDSGDYDFSFSGLKTSISNIVGQVSENQTDKPLTINDKRNLCASIEAAIIYPLVKKTVKAAKEYKVEQIIIAGGVAANQKLRTTFDKEIKDQNLNIKTFFPEPILCTDNAAMIAAAAFFLEATENSFNLQANPNLSLAY